MEQPKRYEMFAEADSNYYRIVSLIDIPEYGIKKGSQGGRIKSEQNFPQDSTGWISYDSTVMGTARVTGGLVKESIIKDNARILGGVIYKSTISGRAVIGENITIENSKITGGLYQSLQKGSVGIVKDSKIIHLSTASTFHLQNVHVFASKDINCYAPIDWENVNIDVDNGKVNWSATLKNVIIDAEEMLLDETVTMEYADIRPSGNFILGHTSTYETLRYKRLKESLILGRKDNKIRFTGERLSVSNSTISGTPSLEGNLIVKNSSIMDSANVSMNGLIENSVIAEFGTVKGDLDKKSHLFNKRIDGDMLYEFR
ncbi:hypothetical protein JMA_39000 (plasmid) [Jeotgalibacillus malaysiensis]|uniref:Uncharacterized protein n=1 Tax=Jeotgalibacillus malaysiensis TaxID=1508404 RepID=A0A0B5AXC1_9BACL|nr:hypothetical protein [Jeotgalibacillus malaysiensis]AJD93218.1 hypothetical protein JMA_39000 [Jeotgalibacillus malaysiensis]